ncbi:MAG: S41 family peptidase [Rhodospirillales bacterium]|jgi:carboxyl-terminal processing protease|nr:S41 family peptidase [Rhodospirillales bacterium]
MNALYANGLRSIGLVLVLVLTACAPARQMPDRAMDAFPRETARETFAAGYASIVEKYIEPIAVGAVAFEGLRGLSAVDPALSVVRNETTVALLVADDEVARFAVPKDDDVKGWVSLTTEISLTGRTASPALKAAAVEKIYEAVFDGALSSLDVFSRYSGAEDAKRNRARRDGFGGIGIRFRAEEGTVRVTTVMKDTPAAKVGLQADDRITHIDGFPTKAMDKDEIVAKLRGLVKSRVVLTIRRADKALPLRFEVVRAHIVPDTVVARRKDGVLHLRVSGFNQNTARSAADTLRAERRRQGDPLRGAILDMRGNPGGLLKQAVRLVDLFLSEGLISSTRGRHPDSIHRYEAGGSDLSQGLPMVVLVDGKSASAAEIVAAALQDRGRAVVVGTTSYGKGTVQTVIRLPNEGELTLTWSRFIAPSGYAIHGLGVSPGICTSGAAGDGADELKSALSGRMGTVERHANWRSVGIYDEERRRDLRAVCPSQRRVGDTELTIARHLFDAMPLYSQALDMSSSTATASTEPASP